jgi:hypothetical protein
VEVDVDVGRDVRVDVVEGLLPSDVEAAILACEPQVTSRTFQRLVEMALRRLGYATRREVRVADRGDGRSGRIDLVAVKGSTFIALELDRCSARKKSLAKLACFGRDAVKVVVVHEPFGGWSRT